MAKLSLQQKIAAAIQKEQAVNQEAGSLAKYPMVANLSNGHQFHLNPRVTAAADTLSRVPPTHLQLTPMVDEGLLVVQAACEGEPRAAKLARKGGTTSALYAGSVLKTLGVEATEGKFPVRVETVTVAGEQRRLLIIQVKEKPKRTRGKKTNTEIQLHGANPVPVIVPCHRVIGSNGKLTGYAGGLGLKQRLLELEGRFA